METQNSIHIHELQALSLFRQMTIEALQTMMDCFEAREVSFQKHMPLFDKSGIVGCFLTEGEDYPIGTLFPMPTKQAPLLAKSAGRLLLMDSHMLFYPCYGCCFFHAQLLQNLREDGVDFLKLEGK